MNDMATNMFGSLILTVISYMGIPLIFLMLNGRKYEEKTAKRIALWNSVVIGILFFIITVSSSNGRTAWNPAPAFLYYCINRWMLTDKKASKSPSCPTDDASSVNGSDAKETYSPLSSHESPMNSQVQPTQTYIYIPSGKQILYCRKCGKKLTSNSPICTACGTSIITDNTAN